MKVDVIKAGTTLSKGKNRHPLIVKALANAIDHSFPIDHQVERKPLSTIHHHLTDPVQGPQQGTHTVRFCCITELPHPQCHTVAPKLLFQPIRGAFCDHPSGIDDRHSIREGLDLLEVVAAEQHAGALTDQLA